MMLYGSRNNKSNQLLQNLQYINAKYSPSTHIDSYMSSSSSSSYHLRGERQTTAGGMSKSISYRSFSRGGGGGIVSDRKHSQTYQIKTESDDNCEEMNPRSAQQNSQILRGVRSEKSLVNIGKVNPLAGVLGKQSSDLNNQHGKGI